MKRHALITGGAGFIGSHLADVLLARGFEVTVLDCLLAEVHAADECDLDGWPTHLDPRVRRIRGDVRDAEAFEAALEGVTHLAHLAAAACVGDPLQDVLGAAVMLDVLAERSHRVRRIALASSMAVYGEGHYGPTSDGRYVSPAPRGREQLHARRWEATLDGEILRPKPTPEDKPVQPTSVRGVAKRDEEEMFLSAGRALGIPTVALRLSQVYGSRQAARSSQAGVAAMFASRLLEDRRPQVFEDGEQQRDFIHVLDVADAFASVLEADTTDCDICNLGSGRPVTIVEMARALARLLDKPIAPEILNGFRAGDVRHRFADTSKIERLFGFTPRWDLEVGLREMANWIRSAGQSSSAANAAGS